MPTVPDSRPSDETVHGIVQRHLNAALAELALLGMTDDDNRVYLLEVLAEASTWLADADDRRWHVVEELLTYDQPPFNGEQVSNDVRPLIVSLTDDLLQLIETRSNPADNDYARARAERVDADFAVLERIVGADGLAPPPGAGRGAAVVTVVHSLGQAAS
jgi:hypothetical protein